MTEPPDPRAFQQIYERFLAGEPAPLLSLLADDVVYHLPGGHLGGGVLHGRDALLRRLGAAAGWCDAVHVDLRAVTAADDFIVTIERMQARHQTRVVDQAVCVVWRFVASRCVEMRAVFADQRACDDFWTGFGPSDE